MNAQYRLPFLSDDAGAASDEAGSAAAVTMAPSDADVN
jgi:hypothetical protein